jgi:hypothetical protein
VEERGEAATEVVSKLEAYFWQGELLAFVLIVGYDRWPTSKFICIRPENVEKNG